MGDENLPQKITQDGEYVGSNLPVTREDFDVLFSQRKMLLEFVAKQLRKDVDYGVIPGTPKPTLYKPGAEKLARLFGLGVKLALSDKTIDKSQNFAMFTYKAEIIHLKSGQSISDCEASCNSQEKKYKERTVWVWSDKAKKKEPTKEVTQIFDILNTLQKMAQKRAFVGGVILAVGASDFFTQDFEDVEDAQAMGVTTEVREPASSIPNVTKVTGQAEQLHDNQRETYLAEALTGYEEREMVKQAGFRWDKDAKKWLKQVSAEEAASLPFQTQRVGA